MWWRSLALSQSLVNFSEFSCQSENLATTHGYMHLSPAATEDAIRLLNTRLDAQSRVENGDILDTRSTRTGSN